jgi:hypothetical protein
MASGTYNIYAFANNTPVDRSVRDVRGAGMQGIVGGSPIGAGTEAFFGSIGGSLSRIGNGVAQPFLNYYDFGRTLIDAGAELVGYHWNHESVSNMGQAAESGTTMLQLEMALLEGLGTNVADTVTLGGYATYQYRNGDINDSEYGDRMIGMGLSLLGGVGTLRAAGLGSVTVGQATQVALRTAQTTARAAGRALSQIELNPTALTQFNNGIPLNLLRWKQTGNPLAKIAEGFGTAAERAAPVKTLSTGDNAAILGRNLAREGRGTNVGEAAGHIVASTGSQRQWAAAARSREILAKYRIGINDAANGIPIGTPRPHNTMHTRKFNELVESRLNSVIDAMSGQYGHKAIRTALRRELRAIGRDALGGI